MAAFSFFRPLAYINSPAIRKPHAVLASSSASRTTFHKNIFLSERKLAKQHQVQRPCKLAVRPDVFSCKAQTEPNGYEFCSSTEIVHALYEAINDKNYRKLEELVSDDCYFHDLSFTKPFEGKKQVVSFLRELADSMGNNVKLVIANEHICGSSILILAWHMEWRGKYIPFTRGWSFYECETSGKEQRIKKARVVMEWPIKPGDLALKLLKAVISLFDKFPEASERFLQYPYAPIAWLLRIYDTFIKPVVWPVLSKIIAYYTKLWNIIIYLASYLCMLLVKVLGS